MDEDRLRDLANSIADRKFVDWERAEEETENEEQKAVVRALREISGIAVAHQSWHESLTSPIHQGESSSGQWGGLVLLEKVGEGSFGEVFRARDPQLDREVALKLLREDATGGEEGSAVIEEGRLLARIRHPNVATVYGADRREGRVGLWMEFLHGQTLSALVREQGPFGAREAVLVGLDLCRALAAVHAQGILHRDIKAQNVMRETGGRIVLMDFGVGRDLRRDDRPDRSLSGTPLYLAPELLAGNTSSVRSDIYSLGVLLFYMVSGMFPVRGHGLQELRRAHEQGDVLLLRDLRPDLPDSFIRAVDRALASDPERRYASAGAFEQALQGILQDKSPGASAAPRQWSRRSLVAAVAVLLLTGLGLWVWKARERPGPMTGSRMILVADFENRTGQAVFEPTVRHLTSIALSQSPNIRVFSPEKVAGALKKMRQPSSTRLTPDKAQDLCIRQRIPFWISGEIVRSEPGFTLTISAASAQNGEVVAVQTVSFRDSSELIRAVGDAAVGLRRQLGEPEVLIQQNQRPLEQVTTSSLEALYRFSQALDLHAAGNIELAIKALEIAVHMDSQFGMAYSRLALYTGGTGDYQESFQAAERAYALRDRVSEREAYQISATYHLNCMQYEEALKDFQQAVILDPDDSDSYRQIALLHANLGEPQAGIEPARKARDLPPPSVINDGVLALLLAQSGHPDEALNEVQSARKRFGNDTYLHWPEGIAWQIKGDGQKARTAFKALSEGANTYDSHARLLLAQSLMLDGQIREAEAVLDSGSGMDNRLHFDRNEAMRNLLLAKIHVLQGQTGSAEQDLQRIEELADLPMNLKMLRLAGVVATEMGSLERADRILSRVERLRNRYPSALSRGAAAQIRGVIESARGDFAKARQNLNEARRSWEDVTLLQSQARLWLAQGRCNEAELILKEILTRHSRMIGDFFTPWIYGREVRQELGTCHTPTGNSVNVSVPVSRCRRSAQT
jgi:serine/threonine protein kinase/tetratricopeptide (TPR) repeat protein